MFRASVLILLFVLVTAAFRCNANECFANEVEEHVLEQFDIYGPLSTNREYFGFIYRHEGVIASAISRGRVCRWTQPCEVDTRAAAALIPTGARVLGEWHTHPHGPSAGNLSPEDVRGANRNRHIRCYRAFFSRSDGDIFSWDTNESRLLTAMASVVRLGNYRRQVAQVRSREVQ